MNVVLHHERLTDVGASERLFVAVLTEEIGRFFLFEFVYQVGHDDWR